jgi:hypothetical protein
MSGTEAKAGIFGGSASEGPEGLAMVDRLGLGSGGASAAEPGPGSGFDGTPGQAGRYSSWAGAGLGGGLFVVAGVVACPRSQAEA